MSGSAVMGAQRKHEGEHPGRGWGCSVPERRRFDGQSKLSGVCLWGSSISSCGVLSSSPERSFSVGEDCVERWAEIDKQCSVTGVLIFKECEDWVDLSSSASSSSSGISQTPLRFEEVQYKTVAAGEGEKSSSRCCFFFLMRLITLRLLCVCLHNHSIIGASLPGDTVLNLAKSGWHLYMSEVNKKRRLCPSDKQTHTGAV